MKQYATKHILGIYLFIMFLLGVSYVAIGATNNFSFDMTIWWLLFRLCSLVAIAIGLLLYRPSIWLAIILFATGILFVSFGDIVTIINQYWVSNPYFPLIANIFYIFTYPFFAASLYLIMHRRLRHHPEPGTFLDAFILALAFILVLWTYLLLPNFHEGTSPQITALSVIYPIFDILLWTLLIRLLILSYQIPSMWFLAGAAFASILSDLLFSFSSYGVDGLSGLMSATVFITYTLAGAAILHPSVKVLDTPVTTTPNFGYLRLTLLVIAAFVAPTLIILQDDSVAVWAIKSIVVFGSIIFILVVIRMYMVVHTLSVRDTEIAYVKERTETFGIVSHQLKTPITGALLYTNLVLDGFAGDITPRQRELLIKGKECNQRELRIVDNLLNLSLTESGNMSLTNTSTDIVSLIQGVIATLEPQLKMRHQTLKFNHSRSKFFVDIDKQLIEMVIENIVENASKYSPEHKQITITLRKSGTSCQIIIKDRGVGIAEDDIDALFVNHIRIENPLSKLTTGSGLGLAWAKKIVDLHEGTIEVKSVLGRGSTFTITLPQ